MVLGRVMRESLSLNLLPFGSVKQFIMACYADQHGRKLLDESFSLNAAIVAHGRRLLSSILSMNKIKLSFAILSICRLRNICWEAVCTHNSYVSFTLISLS